MPLTAADIFRRARRILFDPTGVRWVDAELLSFVNDAQNAIVQYRPEAHAINAPVTLVAGTRQRIPAGGNRLLRVIRNLAPSGRAIREVNRLALDTEDPGWHSRTPVTEVTHFAFDQVSPKSFYVYPPAAPGVSVEIVYSAVPAVLVSDSSPLTIGDQYVNQVLDWVLFRALSKDSTYAGDMARSGHYLQQFANGLDVAIKTEELASFPLGNTASRFNAPGES